MERLSSIRKLGNDLLRRRGRFGSTSSVSSFTSTLPYEESNYDDDQVGFRFRRSRRRLPKSLLYENSKSVAHVYEKLQVMCGIADVGSEEDDDYVNDASVEIK